MGPLNIYLYLYIETGTTNTTNTRENGTTGFNGFGCLDKGFNILTTNVIPIWNLWLN